MSRSKRFPVKPYRLTSKKRKDLARLLRFYVDELAAGPFTQHRSSLMDCCAALLAELEG
ncbi:MAG: hypothetical protein M0024_10160 [Nitrospiraceae bacterium]|nr:hypothetical protein [Nitrospiraceae bacterium]